MAGFKEGRFPSSFFQIPLGNRPILLAIPLLVLGCGQTRLEKQVVLHGPTMGTSYNIKIVPPLGIEMIPDSIQGEIDALLDHINRLMSTYDPESELSRFNALQTTEPFNVSPETAQVIQEASRLYFSTGGLFDPTVGPLVDLWGFGPGQRRGDPPPDAEIEKAMSLVGFDHLELAPDHRLKKKNPGTQLDLSAIAKGYAADCVAELLLKEGFQDFMVEIGGEVVVRGGNASGVPWRIGIRNPENGETHQFRRQLSVTDIAVATSGDYFNYFEYDGVTYSHLLNPKTGWPVPESVKSVSVLAPTGLRADGAATAILVMGAAEGLVWAENQPDLEALVYVKTADGSLSERMTEGMEGFLAD